MVYEKTMQYLFVCGCPRSGTTAITDLLNSHPNIAVGMERYKYRINQNRIRKDISIKNLFECDHFFDFHETETNILPSKDKRWEMMYGRLRKKFDNITLVGDKVPFYFRLYEAITASAEEQVRWIFVLREIEQVAASYNKRAADPSDNWPSANDYKAAVKHWNESLSETWKFMKGKPDLIFICEYERIFSGETDYFQQLLEFLGVESQHDCLEYYREMTQGWEHRVHSKKSLPNEMQEYIQQFANLKLRNSLVKRSRIILRDKYLAAKS